VSLGDFAVGPKADQRNQRRHLIMQHLAAQAERIRMLGSAAIDLAWVAAGRLDASVMLANKPWDVAAGVIIAREAGAHVLDLDGSPHTPDSLATISTTPGVESELVELLSRTEANTAIQ
jgi:myo-inositol-1(or 4)-monophosphatase